MNAWIKVLGIIVFAGLSLACASSPRVVQSGLQTGISVMDGSDQQALQLAIIECKKWGKRSAHLESKLNMNLDGVHRRFVCDE